MKHAKIWIIRLALIMVLLLVIAVLIQVTVLPKLIEKALIQGLIESGFTDASVKTRRVTYWGALFQDLIIGEGGGIHVNEIEIHYSPGSILKRHVGTIILSGISATLSVKDGTIEGIPQFNTRGDGWSNLPFDRLEVRSSALNLNWEGREIQIPLDGVMQNTPEAVTTICMKTSLGQGAVTLNASINFNTCEGKGNIHADGVGIEFFEKIVAPSLPTRKLKSTGSLDFEGHFELRDGRWVSKLVLESDQLSIQAEIDSHNLELSFKTLKADAEFASNGAGTINLTTSLNNAPVTVCAVMNIKTREGECEIDIDGLNAGILQEIIAPYLPNQKLKSTGSLAVKGHVAYKDERGVAILMLAGDGFSIQTEFKSDDIKVSPTRLKSEIEFKSDSGEVEMLRGVLEISALSIMNKSQGVTIKDVSLTLPYSWTEEEIRQGSFTIESIHIGDHVWPTLSGILELKEKRLKFAAKGHVLPEVKLDASGWLDWSVDEPSGELSIQVPQFTLKNKNLLAKRVPKLQGYEISGTFSVVMRLVLEKGIVTPHLLLDIDEATLKIPSSDVGLDGITGVIEFQIAGEDSIIFGRLQCDWARGKVSIRDILLELSESRAEFDFHADGLVLQEILDFLEYKGVKGDGRIYGHLPIGVEWRQGIRFSFGDGFFETRPQTGRLQFSKENAMAILGITDEVDPKKASNQETVRLMMLKALQDMEYTELKIIFRNEDKGWMAHLQTQGYGPRGEKENQIPIGGLDININNLDELLNSMILPKLGVSQIKFGNK